MFDDMFDAVIPCFTACPCLHECLRLVIATWFAHTQKCEELSREKRYQKAEQALRSCSFMLTKSSRKFPSIAYMTRGNCARACLKASQFIDMSCIEKQLQSECHTGKNSHRCLDMFRAAPSIVKNFRVLWASLPRVTRLDFLYKLVRESRLA